MDTCKTALPRMRVITKATQGLGQLPMSVTGMVAHGHADGAYAHYSPSSWPGDSNFTISSLAKLFRRLEGAPIRETGDLFPYPPANAFFEALLRGKSRCLESLKRVEPGARRGAVPLPKNLYLQLDNFAKDNKNQYLMAFLSLLTARGVFKEIQVGFLLVGHTHEDIDAYFSHLSKALKSKNTFVVADLMKAFMESQELSFLPEFIQEVGDFKSFVKGYLYSGATKLIGLEEMHLFRFYVESDGNPVMKYKKSAVDLSWLPSETSSRCLWDKDQNGRARLPRGCPKPVPFKPVWGSEVPKPTGNQEKAIENAWKAILNKGFIMVGLEKYIQYWKNRVSKCEGFATAFGPYVEYWERVLCELKEPLPEARMELNEGFWPQHDWRVTKEEIQTPRVNPVDMNIEEEPEPYCGPANEAPRESFNPWIDICPGSWVLLRPEDPAVCPVWQGRALSHVCKEPEAENFGKFFLQYWTPNNSERTQELRYRNCWYGKWVIENSPPTWVDASTIVYGTWSRRVNPKSKTISKRYREAAMENLNRSNEIDP